MPPKKKGKKQAGPRVYQTVVIRKPDPPPEPVDAAGENEPLADGQSSQEGAGSKLPNDSASSDATGKAAVKVLDPETAKLQDIVNQLQEKTEKEITRSIKVSNSVAGDQLNLPERMRLPM